MIDKVFLEKIGLASLLDMVEHLKKFYSHNCDNSGEAYLTFNPLSRDAVDFLQEYVECITNEKPLPNLNAHKKAFLELVERGFFVLDSGSIPADEFLDKFLQ